MRVLGIAGGSLIRMAGREIVDVGPRSAHIAGLPYSAFAKPGEIEDPDLTLLRPKPGDPDDYAAVRAGGRFFALTTTCAPWSRWACPARADAPCWTQPARRGDSSW